MSSRIYVDFRPYMRNRNLSIADVHRLVNEGRPPDDQYTYARVHRTLTGIAKNIDGALVSDLLRLFGLEVSRPFVAAPLDGLDQLPPDPVIDFRPYMRNRNLSIADVHRLVNEGRLPDDEHHYQRVYYALSGMTKEIDSALARDLLRVFGADLPQALGDALVKCANSSASDHASERSILQRLKTALNR